ncbi:MAG: DUF2256 domain-containing protein [Planctomycetaceae bacterium]|nr:DUF2256 domain-containing protein [Planctomycetaceae bacterium]
MTRATSTGCPCFICAACGSPFTWRKCLARNWDRVKYCSYACRKKTPSSN